MKPKARVCKGCGQSLPLSSFNKRASAPDGFRPTCRDCDRFARAHGHRPTPPEAPPETPTPALLPKVIGEIVPAGGTVIKESVVEDEETKKMQEEYASILNRRLPIRRRAAIMVKIATSFKGANAALALKALQDINLATQVVTRTGAQVDLGPIFTLPEGSDVDVSPGK